jgi:NADH:ubiquinone oxidoreductase subunit 6 (subunit J)
MLIFYLFFFFILFFSLNIVLSKNIISSILSLILVFFFSSIFLFYLGLDYIGLIYISIYVGALSVLFLFVIMMLNVRIFTETSFFFFISLFVCIFLSFIFFENYRFFFDIDQIFKDIFLNFNNLVLKKNIINTIGTYLYSQYFFYFILSGIILFIGMIGSVSLVLEPYKIIKSQTIYQQISRSFNNSYFKIK